MNECTVNKKALQFVLILIILIYVGCNIYLWTVWFPHKQSMYLHCVEWCENTSNCWVSDEGAFTYYPGHQKSILPAYFLREQYDFNKNAEVSLSKKIELSLLAPMYLLT